MGYFRQKTDSLGRSQLFIYIYIFLVYKNIGLEEKCKYAYRFFFPFIITVHDKEFSNDVDKYASLSLLKLDNIKHAADF